MVSIEFSQRTFTTEVQFNTDDEMLDKPLKNARTKDPQTPLPNKYVGRTSGKPMSAKT